LVERLGVGLVGESPYMDVDEFERRSAERSTVLFYLYLDAYKKDPVRAREVRVGLARGEMTYEEALERLKRLVEG